MKKKNEKRKKDGEKKNKREISIIISKFHKMLLNTDLKLPFRKKS